MKEVNALKARGVKPVDIDRESKKIRDNFIANGLLYDPDNILQKAETPIINEASSVDYDLQI
jgi:hypothetical protein